jgi:hypothetical protein
MRKEVATLVFVACAITLTSAANWNIKFWTSGVRYAGTDSNIRVQLFGKKGNSQKQLLDDPNNKKQFEANQEDAFNFDAPDLGLLQKIVITSDMKGSGPGWHVAKIELENKKMGSKFTWSPNTWIWTGTKKGVTYSNVLELPVVRNIDWNIKFTTSDVKWAGTDSNIRVQLIGAKGTSPKKLLNDKNNKKQFEKSQVDTFNFKTHDLGALQRIVIMSDMGGKAPGWHVAKIELHNEINHNTYTWDPMTWIWEGTENGVKYSPVLALPVKTD